MQKILDTVDAQLETSLARLFAFLRIPSISAQPAHKPDCLRAAGWIRDELAALGFAARLSETSGLPGVIATNHEAGPEAPHVLFYGHYDVQPGRPARAVAFRSVRPAAGGRAPGQENRRARRRGR